MGRRRLCFIAWTIAAGIVTGALSGSDSQCVANSRPSHLIANQNKTLSFTVQPVGNHASCQWLISSNTANTRLRLTAAIFNLRPYNGSCVDNFTVYDGNSSYSPILLSTCSRPYFPIYSSGSDVLVSFTTGSYYSGERSNFTVNYEMFRPSTTANATITDSVNVDTTRLHFLNYPEGSSLYPNNANRSWVFHTNDSQYVVHITFTYVDVEPSSSGCDYDYIEIFDSSMKANKVDRLCGTLTRRQYYSTGQSLYITFHSNGLNTRTGFNLTYTAELGSVIYPATVCNSNVPLVAILHDKRFLKYPAATTSYGSVTDCGWSIQSNSVNSVVHVTFLSVDLEMSNNRCRFGYVEVFDGSSIASNSLRTICGNQSQQEVYSSGSSMFLKFHSNSYITGRGFHLVYEAVLPSEADCFHDIVLSGAYQSQQYLQYPGNNLAYSNNVNCYWLLHTNSSDYVVHVTFTFVSTESRADCSFDFVEVYDGTYPQRRKVLKLCGQLLQQREFYSSGQHLLIYFHSDVTITGQGFRLTYTSARRSVAPQDTYGACLQDAHLPSVTYNTQYLIYPPSPMTYNNNANCNWLLQTSIYDYVVHVTFTFVDMGANSYCFYDYVELFDGSSRYAPSLGKVCQFPSRDFYSSGSSMYIRFISDGLATRGGFEITYQAVSRSTLPTTTVTTTTCSLFPTSQTAYSSIEEHVQYPTTLSNYPNNADCRWLFKTWSDDYVVHVTFTSVDTQYDSDCAKDYIEVFDGSSDYSVSLGRLCGTTSRDFYSSGQSVYIKFHSDGSTTGGGFRLSYKAVTSWDKPVTSWDKPVANRDVPKPSAGKDGYSRPFSPAGYAGVAVGTTIFTLFFSVVIALFRRYSLQHQARNRSINTNNNRNIVSFHPTNVSATHPGPPTVIGRLPSVPAVPPSNILSPPSYTADPPSYEVVMQGASYPKVGVNTTNNLLPQGSQYPTTGRAPVPAGAPVTSGQVNQSFST